eukprot:TRINITY_DN3039_c0_g1_i1.p1 TRINITY_DN3039_c0_g1~~TRINITY_DN3039_c0_g1_i1.p1  ORF type:complete len:298 (+),score=107.52 TRINITY_DN3039_c0_g1_i1:17-910(+)
MEQPQGLAQVLSAIDSASAQIAKILRNASTDRSGTSNKFGDDQLQVDLSCDEAFFKALKDCGRVSIAASEEKPEEIDLGGTGFSVAFDPLDGSSIIDANWSVGTIFGIWQGSGLLGKSGKEQIAAGFTVFGPRTTMMRVVGSGPVQEFTLFDTEEGTEWRLTKDEVVIKEDANIFAPANLRVASEIEGYRKAIDYWMQNRYTLRYSGGMVPDVNHILIKGKGIFSSPISAKSPAKLRLLFECAPIARVVVAAGGLATAADAAGSDLLDVVAKSIDQRSAICLGSANEVKRFTQFLSQ